MTTRIRYSGGDAYIGVGLGDLQHVTEHTGQDHVSYIDIRYQHAVLLMTAADLGVLVRRGQETLAALPPPRDCSGARADLDNDG